MRFYHPKIHSTFFLLGLMGFAASIPLSNFVMSLAQWVLVANLFLGQGLGTKLRRLWKNKAALLIIGIFLIHAIGIFWSQDLQYALKDLRVKLPILIITFVLAAEGPVSYKQFRIVMLTHALAVLIGSLFITWRVYGLGIIDLREASNLISHIRFALNVCLAIFALIYFTFRDQHIRGAWRIIPGSVALWLIAFLFILQAITGLMVFVIVSGALLIREMITHKRKIFKITAGVILLLGSVIFAGLIYQTYRSNFKPDVVDVSKLDFHTPYGNTYIHNLENLQKENGHYLWLYVCPEELEEGWNKRSPIDYDSLDRSGQKIEYTLIRFLTSKGLRKDLDGIARLSNTEIRAIENGVANVEELEDPGFMRKMERLLWEFNDYAYIGDPSGHSFMQRVELWRAGSEIIITHPVIGVGTGDVPNEFKEKLNAINSPLKEEGLRTHNQYLAIAVALGIPAALYFLFVLFYAPLRQRQFHSYFFFAFFLIGLLSMLSEDTLESQPGVSFFMFFYCFLMFTANEKYHSEQSSLGAIG